MKRKNKKTTHRTATATASPEPGASGLQPAQELPRWAMAIPVLVPLAVYFYTAAPGVTLVDSGEFVLACSKLGIGHAPGVPTYVLLGHLFSLLPLSADLARRTNLYSSFCAALAAGFSYLLTRELMRDLDPRMALAAALAFGFSLSLWGWAVVTEVYALNILLVTIMLWLAARGDWIPGCFVAGLALGVHHATVLMTLPPALYLAWIRRRPSAKVLLLAALAGLAGLSVYLYLPLRAAQHPVLNWGDPETLERFWWHITGKQYHASIAAALDSGLGLRVRTLAELALRQLTPVGLLLAIAGLHPMFQRYRSIFWFTLGIVGLNVGFVIITGLGGTVDVAGYYMPSFLTMVWCFALGAEWLAVRLGGLRRKRVLAVVFAVALAPAVVNFSSNNRHEDRIARLFIENSLRGVPPGSLVLNRDWNFFSPWLAMRYAQGWDPGVEVINTDFLRKAWFLPMLEQEYPDLYRAASAEIAVYRRQVDQMDRVLPDHDVEAARTFAAVVQKMIRTKLDAGAAVFYTMRIDGQFLPDHPIAPHGLLYEYAQGAEDVELDVSGLLGEVPLDESSNRVRQNYANMLTVRGADLMNSGQYEAARQKLDLALRLDPGHEKAVQLKKILMQ
jgi:hypothetical protein